jgi:DNA-binding transcriptional MerR regulator
MTIGAVAALSGKWPSSIRYYEQIGPLRRRAARSGWPARLVTGVPG